MDQLTPRCSECQTPVYCADHECRLRDAAFADAATGGTGFLRVTPEGAKRIDPAEVWAPPPDPRDAEIARLRAEAQRLVADHEKAKADMVAGDPWLDSLVQDLASFVERVARGRTAAR